MTEIIHKEHFEHWLFSQPDERRFDFLDIEGCLGCSFVRETTPFSKAVFSGYFWKEALGQMSIPLPEFFLNLTRKVTVDYGSHFTIADTKRAWLKLFPETSTETLTTQQNEPTLCRPIL